MTLIRGRRIFLTPPFSIATNRGRASPIRTEIRGHIGCPVIAPGICIMLGSPVSVGVIVGGGVVGVIAAAPGAAM